MIEFTILLAMVSNFLFYLFNRHSLVTTLREKWPSEYKVLGDPHPLGMSSIRGVLDDGLGAKIQEKFPQLLTAGDIKLRLNLILIGQIMNFVLAAAFFFTLVS